MKDFESDSNQCWGLATVCKVNPVSFMFEND